MDRFEIIQGFRKFFKKLQGGLKKLFSKFRITKEHASAIQSILYPEVWHR